MTHYATMASEIEYLNRICVPVGTSDLFEELAAATGKPAPKLRRMAYAMFLAAVGKTPPDGYQSDSFDAHALVVMRGSEARMTTGINQGGVFGVKLHACD